MNWFTIAIALIVFTITVLLVLLAAEYWGRFRVSRRVSEVVGANKNQEPINLDYFGLGKFIGLNRVVEKISKLALPEMGWRDSTFRLRFVRAGFRDANFPKYFFAVKSFLFMALPFIVVSLSFFGTDVTFVDQMFYLVVFAAIGYYLPEIYLSIRTKSRRQSMQMALPDIIDLLIICAESGLGMDAAINRVSREGAVASGELAEEFYLTALEVRAGAGRANALSNLAVRANFEDMNSFVTMLLQADKFGTSLTSSLRVQSDLMRVKRMQRAEEAAAKVPVKMLIPLVLFIFPALFIVLLGPAVLQLREFFS